jgi:MFS family permease
VSPWCAASGPGGAADITSRLGVSTQVRIVSISALPASLRTTVFPFRVGPLSDGAAFALQVSIVVFLLAGSSAPTPLYAVYQAAWGFSPITVTAVFGIYAVAVLAALLIFGSLSDHVGRRPILLVALALQAVTMLIFSDADSVGDLVLARLIQGLSTGAAVSALGAGLLDLHRVRGTLANAVSPMVGSATGAIGSSLLVQYLPAPTHLVYLLLLGIFTLQAVGVILMPELTTRKSGALASLRPRFAVPQSARRQLLLGIPALVAIWALVGFYGSLGPALVRLVSGSSSFVLGGLSLFTLAASGGVTVLLIRSLQPRTVALLGAVALFVGVASVVLATAWMSPAMLFVGTVVAGVGFGAGFQGVLRTVLPLIAPTERAGTLSVIYAISNLAMGVPAVIGGLLAVQGGVLLAGREYGVAIMVLAVLTLVGLARAPQPTPAPPLAIAPPVIPPACPQVCPLAGQS